MIVNNQRKILSNWFDPNNYSGMKELDAYGWHAQLLFRFERYTLLKQQEKDNNSYLNPISKGLIIPEDEYFEQKKIVTIRSANLQDMNSAIDNWKKNDSLISEKAKNIFESNKHLLEGAKYSPHMDNIYECLISVDLSGSDAQIKADLKSWLKEIRKLQANLQTSKEAPVKGKEYTLSSFQVWTLKKLLPFIDIFTWYEINNIQINAGEKRNILEILHPEERGNFGNIAYTNHWRDLKRLYEQVFNLEMITRLEYQPIPTRQ